MPSLSQLGFSRLFTAQVVDHLRSDPKFSDPLTVDDLLDRDPDLAYLATRAAGADSLRYEASSSRRRARVEKWLAHFADADRPLPTTDGADDARFVAIDPPPPSRPGPVTVIRTYRFVAHARSVAVA